jgi:hypothetical protein
LGDGHLGILLSERLDNDKASREGGHEVGVAGKGIECRCGGGLGNGGNGCSGGWNRGGEWSAGSEAQWDLSVRLSQEKARGDSRTVSTINAQPFLWQECKVNSKAVY